MTKKTPGGLLPGFDLVLPWGPNGYWPSKQVKWAVKRYLGWFKFAHIRSALGYLTKERTPQAAWPKWQYRRGAGAVLGKRFKISANLSGRATPKSIRIENHRSTDLEAALAKLKTAVTRG